MKTQNETIDAATSELIRELTRQRDELLEACKALLPHVSDMIERANPQHEDTSAYSDQRAVAIARAAIAHAEGGAA